VTTATETADPTEASGWPVLGEQLSDHRNSLNFLRLGLASVVLLSHAASLGNFGDWAGIVNGTSAAQIALYGFFAISGYLIVQSAIRSTSTGYLWKRTLRIFPGLIFCLLLTACFFGVVAWLQMPHPGCGWSCYIGAPDGPAMYVVKNSLLANPFWTQHSIAGTPQGWLIWNDSIWTLFYEFLCYLLVLALAVFGMLRRRICTLVVTLVLWAAMAVIMATPALAAQFTVYHHCNLESLIRFSTLFLAASTLYLYRERVPDRWWLAAACAIIYAISVLLPTGGLIPTFSFTPGDIGMPFLIYTVLWLGIHLPFRTIGSKNDYSYGIYIYGWPITELMILWHANRLGLPLYLTLCFVATIPFAVASWWLVEKRSLRLKNLLPRAQSGAAPLKV
jgi:hypothetical protein